MSWTPGARGGRGGDCLPMSVASLGAMELVKLEVVVAQPYQFPTCHQVVHFQRVDCMLLDETILINNSALKCDSFYKPSRSEA